MNIDDDVLFAVRGRARRERRPAGAVLSDLAREALTGRHRAAGPAREPNGLPTLPRRGPAVSNALIDRLGDGEAD